MGGQMGFGPVDLEPNEPPFHADWERRAFGVALAMGATGAWTLDASRHARESLPPAEYLSSSYYEIWAKGVQKLVLQTGLITEDELVTGRVLSTTKPVERVLKPEQVPPSLAAGSPTERSPVAPARFAAGDQVVTRNIHPWGHTRLPRYARAKRGTVERVHGAHVFPDSNAHGRGGAPQWLYTVCFSGSELWGDDGDPNSTISIDAWESYLEPA
jgi:nitrile hydratase beta subunit